MKTHWISCSRIGDDNDINLCIETPVSYTVDHKNKESIWELQKYLSKRLDGRISSAFPSSIHIGEVFSTRPIDKTSPEKKRLWGTIYIEIDRR